MITHLQTLGWFGSEEANRFRSVPPKTLKLQLLGRPLADPQSDVWLVTDRQTTTTIAPLVGDEVIFSLEENPSTGYRWDSDLPAGLAVDDEDFVEPAPVEGEERIGGQGRRRLYVSVTKGRDSRARFALRTPWDPEERPTAALDVAVDADERPQPGVDEAQRPALLAT
jgi:predicted secreted protein